MQFNLDKSLKYCYRLDSAWMTDKNTLKGKLITHECFLSDTTQYVKIIAKQYQIIEGSLVEINFKKMNRVHLNIHPPNPVKNEFKEAKNHSFTGNNSCDYIRLHTGEIINVQVLSFYPKYLAYQWCCEGCSFSHYLNIEEIDSIAISNSTAQFETENMKEFLFELEQHSDFRLSNSMDSTHRTKELDRLSHYEQNNRKVSQGLSIGGGVVFGAVLVGWILSEDPSLYWDLSLFSGGPSGPGVPYFGLVAGTCLFVGAVITNKRANEYGYERFSLSKRY